jgi:hypothetical protein
MSKRCADCGEVKNFSFFHKNAQQKDGYNCYCKTCAADRNKNKYIKSCKNHEWKLKQTLKASKQRAEKNNLEHTLTLDDLKHLYPQDNKCPILNIDLCWGFPKDSSPSLDRINSKQGYTYENCQIISNRANRIKSDASVDELELVVKYLKEI